MALEVLPLEILELILGYLGALDRLSASSVCKQWYLASLNINLWKDAAILIGAEKGAEGLNVLKNSERPFSCVVFQDCSFSQDSHALFCHALDMCKVVGQRLSVLQFKNCTISGCHFTEILTQCPNLQHLSVVNCESLFSQQRWLSDLEEINRLKLALQNVKELDLSCNRDLTDLFFTRLAQIFTNVSSLSLEECPINFQAVIFKRFYPRPNITPSDNILTFSRIRDFILRNVMRITSVNFNATAIDDTTLKSLAHMEGLQLECISFSRCQLLTASGISEFCHYQKKLKKLWLPSLIALDQVLPEICSSLSELRELHVGKSWPPEKVSSIRALQMHALNKLVKVDLSICCEVIVLKFIDSLRNEAFPRLRHLNLFKDMVDDFLIIYTIPYLLHITYLDLGGTLISDKSLIMISTHLVHLQVLKLAQCETITDKGLTGQLEAKPEFLLPEGVIVQNQEGLGFGNREFLKFLVFDEDHPIALSNLKGLRDLDLYDIDGISDDGIKVALAFRELRSLRIGCSSKITDEGLCAIGKNNSSLEVLSVQNSSYITENGIAKILNYLPRLKSLDLQGCTNLKSSAISHIVKEYSCNLRCKI